MLLPCPQTLSKPFYEKCIGGIFMTKDMENILRDAGIVPVIKISDAEYAAELADALCLGKIPVSEVTFRTSAAAKSIYNMRLAHPEMLVGAGTILTLSSLDEAICAGAQFIVSPGLNPKIVEKAMSRDIPIIPGCVTPTEIEFAMSMGLNFVKFFPAEAAGGVKFIKAISAPYSDMRFMPTGGISVKNAADYLSLPCVVCCGASFIATDEQISGGRFDEITKNAETAKRIADTVRNI